MKAAILAIGTELTDGQILNKNAYWISNKLKTIGLNTELQLVVPDERELMLEGMKFCAAKAELLFVTGGLGPTSDDFTREIISEWAGTPLQFDPQSWEQINDRLISRGYVVKEIQRQQCYFPAGAQILQNSEGTANAFYLEAHNKKVFILPGPPREIEAVWKSSIDSWLRENTKHIDPVLTKKWQTIGLGESDVALIVEEKLKDIQIQKGYRVHMPYVEVKVTYLKSSEKALLPSIEKLDQALKFCTISRDEDDVLDLFIKKLSSIKSMMIVDQVTGPFLMNRLMTASRSLMTEKKWHFGNTLSAECSVELLLSLTNKDEHSCEVCMEYKKRKFKTIISSPYKTMTMQERRRQYFAEMALVFWLANLN